MKIYHVKKARKAHRCSKCGGEIKAGESYRWWAHRYGPETKWHEAHGYPPPSVLTTSDKLSRLYEAQEDISQALEEFTEVLSNWDPEDPKSCEAVEEQIQNLVDTIDQARSTAQEVGEEYEESASNMEEYFEGSPQVDEIRDKSYSCEEWANELETVQSSAENLQGALEDIEDSRDSLESLISEVESARDSLEL